MGLYLNIGNKGFASARKGEYVDKSGLIGIINQAIYGLVYGHVSLNN